MLYFNKSISQCIRKLSIIVCLTFIVINVFGLSFNSKSDSLVIEKANNSSFLSYDPLPDFIVPVISKVSSSSDDDAEEETSDGSVNLISTDLEMINDGVDQVVGLRFNNLDIPQCAPITSASIKFVAKFSGMVPNIDPCNLTIYGESADNAVTFSNTDFDISSRQKTTASVVWSPAQ